MTRGGGDIQYGCRWPDPIGATQEHVAQRVARGAPQPKPVDRFARPTSHPPFMRAGHIGAVLAERGRGGRETQWRFPCLRANFSFTGVLAPSAAIHAVMPSMAHLGRTHA